MLYDTLGRLHDQPGTDLHQTVMHIARSIVGTDAHLVAQNDAAGIYVLVYHEGGHAGDALPVDHRPVYGSRAAVLRQQGGVQIESAEPGHAPDLFRKHAERHHDEQIRLPRSELRKELGILQLERLQHGKTMLHGVLLDRGLMHFQPAPARLVRHGNHAYNLVPRLHQGVERRHGELGSPHEHYPRRTEETQHPALDFTPVIHKRIIAEKSRVLDGPRSEICTDGAQDQGGDERPKRGTHGSVPRELRAGDVHHPVEHEKQHCDDGAHP